MQLLPYATNHRGADAKASALEILDAVPAVIWEIRRDMRRFRKGLSLPQFRALARVDREPCTSLSAVAEHLGTSLPTTSRLVARLVNKGLLKRKICTNDRRQVSLVVTPRGQEMLNHAWKRTWEEMELRLSGLSDKQQRQVHEAMKILKSVFGSVGLTERLQNPSKTTGQCDVERCQ